ATVDHLPLFVQRELLVDAGPVALDVAMKVGDVGGDERAVRVVPGPITNAIACVHGGPATCRGHAEIRAPGLVPGADRRRERLAVSVRALDPTEIAAVPDTCAGDEEAHGL